MNRILVFGGTFNPLSKAHGELIFKAKKYLNADKIILLPTGNRFLNERKKYNNDDMLDPNLRMQILDEFKKRNPDIIVENIEFNGTFYKTYDSLDYLSKKYNGEIWFAFGAEKFSEFKSWYKWNELLEKYHFFAFNRSNLIAADEIKKYPEINKYSDKFSFLEDTSLKDISSTKIRECIKLKDYKTMEELTYPFVIKLIKESQNVF